MATYKNVKLNEAFPAWLSGRTVYVIDNGEADPLRESQLIALKKTPTPRWGDAAKLDRTQMEEQVQVFLAQASEGYLQKTGESLELNNVSFFVFLNDRPKY